MYVLYNQFAKKSEKRPTFDHSSRVFSPAKNVSIIWPEQRDLFKILSIYFTMCPSFFHASHIATSSTCYKCCVRHRLPFEPIIIGMAIWLCYTRGSGLPVGRKNLSLFSSLLQHNYKCWATLCQHTATPYQFTPGIERYRWRRSKKPGKNFCLHTIMEVEKLNTKLTLFD
jgi:hypothetical protein